MTVNWVKATTVDKNGSCNDSFYIPDSFRAQLFVTDILIVGVTCFVQMDKDE